MRIYRYASNRGGLQPRLAIAAPEKPPCDLIDSWQELEGGALPPYLTSVATLIEQGPEFWQRIEDLAQRAADESNLHVQEIEWEVTWLCPFDAIASLRDFLAFESHVKLGAARRGGEVPAYWYEAPVYYKGNHRSIIGPEEICPWPSYTTMLDFELELAMVIGTRGRDVPAAEGASHVFGFTVMNDFSARDIQSKEMSAWLGPAKGKDFATALGPCIVTASEVGAAPDLQMICRVNGEEWGRARSSQMHWSWEQIIEHASRDEDIFPVDVYGSGTPGGCCGLDIGRNLSPGDEVELEIESIGVLRNPIARI